MAERAGNDTIGSIGFGAAMVRVLSVPRDLMRPIGLERDDRTASAASFAAISDDKMDSNCRDTLDSSIDVSASEAANDPEMAVANSIRNSRNLFIATSLMSLDGIFVNANTDYMIMTQGILGVTGMH